jgi:signal transduction histidine kinase
VAVTEFVKELEAEMREVRKHSPLDFAWQVEAELPFLQTDPGKLKVVLKNLIRNAVKFTTEGRITVAARSSRAGVEFRVADTGMGIPPQALALIFEPFQQVENSARHQSGTGLGLHIVKRLLERLGGTITVESEVGRGSTFYVWIPTKSREKRTSAETSSALRERGPKAARIPSSPLIRPHSQTRPALRPDQSPNTRRG